MGWHFLQRGLHKNGNPGLVNSCGKLANKVSQIYIVNDKNISPCIVTHFYALHCNFVL